MLLACMRVFALSLFILAAVSLARPARAQDPAPRIGPFVIDLHGTFPRFPDDQLVADSRNMSLAELPGTGLGVQVGFHVYPVRWKAITIGLGGEYAAGRARQTAPEGATNLRSAEERFTSIAPQLSLNFGNGHGWSYISGGLGNATWSIVPQGQDGYPPDSEKLKTVNYGFGARWFARSHLAFSFDVRFYAINPGLAGQIGTTVLPQSPRTTLMIIGAGVSVK
jgi:outer membrane protein with beta-barrel domain